MPDTDPFAIPAASEPGEDVASSSSATEDDASTSSVAEPPAEPAVADDVLLASVDVARAALLEITPASTIGPPAGHIVEGDHLLSLLFECTLVGYPDWYWTVSLARVDDEAPTVLEAELMPGEGALLAPDWVPWSERLAEYQASQEASRAAESNGDDDEDDTGDDDDDLDDVDSDDDGDIDGVDIDALHEQPDDADYADEDFEANDITGVELATLELQEDEADDAESDAGNGGPEQPNGVDGGQRSDEDDEDDQRRNP